MISTPFDTDMRDSWKENQWYRTTLRLSVGKGNAGFWSWTQVARNRFAALKFFFGEKNKYTNKSIHSAIGFFLIFSLLPFDV